MEDAENMVTEKTAENKMQDKANTYINAVHTRYGNKVGQIFIVYSLLLHGGREILKEALPINREAFVNVYSHCVSRVFGLISSLTGSKNITKHMQDLVDSMEKYLESDDDAINVDLPYIPELENMDSPDRSDDLMLAMIGLAVSMPGKINPDEPLSDVFAMLGRIHDEMTGTTAMHGAIKMAKMVGEMKEKKGGPIDIKDVVEKFREGEEE